MHISCAVTHSANTHSLATANGPCTPGRTGMPRHLAGKVSHASKAPGDGLGLRTRRRTGLSSQQVVWAPKLPPGPLLFHEKRP